MNDKMMIDYILYELFKKGDIVKKLGYEPVYIALRGSQNYNLDVYTKDYQSDIDAVCYIVPDKKSLIRGDNKISFTHVCEDNSHIEIKDIRLLIELCQKTNIAFLETLCTDYFIIFHLKNRKLINEIRDQVNVLARGNIERLLKTTKGMFMQKKAALYKDYPSQHDVIEKYGYAPKQLHHMCRLMIFLRTMSIENLDYKESIICSNDALRYRLIDLKTKTMPLDDAKIFDERCTEDFLEIYNIMENRFKNNLEDFNNSIEIISNNIYKIVEQMLF